MSDLQQELAVAVELEDLVFTRPGRASPGDPDIVLVVDEDPMLVVGEWPFVPAAGSALPTLEQSPRRIELHDHRRRLAARLFHRDARASVNDPHVVFGICRDASHGAKNPIVRNRWP
jgi:hypothetical protein